MSQDGSTTGNRASDDRALQFDVVEPAAPDAANSAAGSLVCQRCKSPITTSYYEIRRVVVCARCRDELNAPPSGTRAGRMLRALGYGLVAAVAGSVLYFAIAAATGYELGIVAIAVGYGIGKAVRKGSGGRGGRKYQLLALGLTYLAIVSTYVPAIVREIRNEQITRGSSTALVRQAGTPRDPALDSSARSAEHVAPPRAPSTVRRATEPAAPRLAGTVPASQLGSLVIGMLALLAMAIVSPFLAGESNLIGLVIIGVALYEAWKLNRRVVLQFSGPYQVGTGPAAAGG